MGHQLNRKVVLNAASQTDAVCMSEVNHVGITSGSAVSASGYDDDSFASYDDDFDAETEGQTPSSPGQSQTPSSPGQSQTPSSRGQSRLKPPSPGQSQTSSRSSRTSTIRSSSGLGMQVESPTSGRS